jgi:SAM-dependent methyltransferase
MGFIGGEIGYQMLRRISPHNADSCGGQEEAHSEGSELEKMFGAGVWDEVRDQTVIDFGCGVGTQAIEMAQHGARKVIGLDIRESMVEAARRAAQNAGLAERCVFTTATDEQADLIFSLDSFEHFDDPAEVLRVMRRLLRDDGSVRISFGWPWYHPLGGHLFSVFPWAHLIFTERALLRWRSDFKDDGATRFCEVDGGLNGMTIRRFEELIGQSDFRIAEFEAVPIKKLKFLAGKWTREFSTAFVRCRLMPR